MRDDAELVGRALAGHQEAFSTLVNRYKEAVYGTVLNIVADFDAAEDIAQESFIKAYLQLRTLDQPERFGNWLRIIAANQARSHHRRRRILATSADDLSEAALRTAQEQIPQHVLSAEELELAREREEERKALEKATLSVLGRLSETKAQVLTLYYLGGHTLGEVAEFLDISGAAAKMRLHRARKQLQEEAVQMVEKILQQKKPGAEFSQRFQFAELTVFTADAREFERSTRDMGAVETAELLYEYHNEMTDILMEYGGTLDRYDNKGGIMAFYGAPVAHQDHAHRACLAALDMRDRLAAWPDAGRPTLAMRCYLSTGEVLVGNMGSKYRTDYTIAGDAVNLAERLQMSRRSKVSITIGQSTYERAGDALEIRELDQITFWGYSDPVTIYEVLDRRGELRGERAEIIGLYEEGLAHYKRREWEKALDFFERAAGPEVRDWPSKRYAQRCWIHLQVPHFDELAQLSGQDLQEAMRHIDYRDLLMALRESDAPITEAFLTQMSQRVRRFMEEEMEAVGLTAWSKEEIAEKQEKIVEITRQQARKS